MFYICTIVMPFTVLQCVNKDIIYIKLIDHVSKQMENGKTPGNLYIDLSIAFDTLAFDILLFKLNIMVSLILH